MSMFKIAGVVLYRKGSEGSVKASALSCRSDLATHMSAAMPSEDVEKVVPSEKLIQ
jgi:hypothetical protein